MAIEKVNGKWVISDWKQRTTKQKSYLFTWYLWSEMDLSKMHAQKVNESDLQTFLDKMSENNDIAYFDCWEKRTIDFEEEKEQ